MGNSSHDSAYGARKELSVIPDGHHLIASPSSHHRTYEPIDSDSVVRTFAHLQHSDPCTLAMSDKTFCPIFDCLACKLDAHRLYFTSR